MEKRTLQKLGLLCASVALCSAASWWSGNNEAEQSVQKLTEQPVVEQVQEIKITICVSGAVAKPGLYEVKKGSRAQQVIEMAGGVTEEADMDRVNLAQLCKDGGHIKVPRLSKARMKKKMEEKQTLDDDNASALQQAYINKMINARDMDQLLTAQGLTGGASETNIAKMLNNYANNRNSLNRTYNTNLRELLTGHESLLADALSAYNDKVANARQSYSNYLAQLEQNRANMIASAMPSFSNLLSLLG